MVASGYYDLICPFFDAEITFARYGIPQDRVDMTYYQGGHMMYLNDERPGCPGEGHPEFLRRSAAGPAAGLGRNKKAPGTTPGGIVMSEKKITQMNFTGSGRY
jgi:hypothetical protein